MSDGDDKKGKSRTIQDPVAGRHEESVLFTVGQLGAMRGKPPAGPAPAPPPTTAEPGDDESGFINLNNLAGAAGFVRGEAEAAPTQSAPTPVEGDAESGFINLGHLSAMGGSDAEGAPSMGAVPQLDIPMGIPMGREPEDDTKGVKIAIGVASVFLLVAVVFLVYVVATRGDEPPKDPGNVVVIPERTPVIPDTGLVVVAPVLPKAVVPEEDAGMDRDAAIVEAADAEVEPDAAKVPAVLADAGSAPAPDTSKAPPEATPPSKVPLGLNRTQVKTVIAAHRAQVDTCGGERRGGTVIVRFTILPSGAVGGTRVINEKKGSPEGACVAGIVRDMKFPAFGGASITINYPFVLPER